MLCVCLGIVEGAMLLLAGIFASIPFVSKLFRKRRRRSCEPGNQPRRPRYVTSTDLIKMRKRDKK